MLMREISDAGIHLTTLDQFAERIVLIHGDLLKWPKQLPVGQRSHPYTVSVLNFKRTIKLDYAVAICSLNSQHCSLQLQSPNRCNYTVRDKLTPDSPL